MQVYGVETDHFRLLETQSVAFAPGVNVITGANAQGKTTLLEAVWLLTGGKSFRTWYDRELIAFGQEEARVEGSFRAAQRDQKMELRFYRGRTRQLRQNGVKKRPSEATDALKVILFSPDDLGMVRGPAAGRRRLLDGAISQLRPGYAAVLSDYNKLYENKLRILKDWREKPDLLDTLDEFSDGICRISAQLIRYRAAFTERLREEATRIHRSFSGNGEELEIGYRTVSTVKDPTASAKEIYYEICDHQERHRQAEIESGMCLTGAHKDDLEISINGKNARMFASQGQTRTAALSIKLAEREIFLAETGEYPVLLLDDVLSELDEKRQSFVLNRIGGGQTLITCCEDMNISSRTGGKIFLVSGGRIR